MKGLFSLFLGLALGLVGIDQLTGDARFSFGIPQLLDGIDVVILVIGLFAVGETLYQAWRHGRERARGGRAARLHRHEPRRVEAIVEAVAARDGDRLSARRAAVRRLGDSDLRVLHDREAAEQRAGGFGHGAIEGVAGPEAANNAAAAGVLVPLLTLGLPSSATAAVMLAAFQQYGLQPGPLLFSSRPDLVWTLIASLYIGNVMLLVLNLPLVGVWARVMLVPRPLLFGGILVLASLGAYSLNRSLLDLALLYRRRRRRLRDARLRRSARAGGARSGPRPAVGAAVPAGDGDQRRRPLVFVTRPISRGPAAARPPWCCSLALVDALAASRRGEP